MGRSVCLEGGDVMGRGGGRWGRDYELRGEHRVTVREIETERKEDKEKCISCNVLLSRRLFHDVYFIFLKHIFLSHRFPPKTLHNYLTGSIH